MYDASDPRAALTATSPATETTGVAPRGAQFYQLSDLQPDEATPRGTRTWLIRTQHLVLAYSDAVAGDTLACSSEDDEAVVLLPGPTAAVHITSGSHQLSVAGETLTVVPPGHTTVEVRESGPVIRLLTTRSTPLAALCRNAETYGEPDPNTAAFVAWPRPPGTSRPRVYPYNDVGLEAGRLGRIYRCSSIMLNIFYPQDGPRDPSTMSPHAHADFEQLSLQTSGTFVHHVRTPWGTDLQQWREDQHERCASPAIAIFPPPLIHTTQAVDDTRHQLIDIFGPPRHDFSSQPGWVLNAADYPES